jgi:P pilus assembly chaperone PapD
MSKKLFSLAVFLLCISIAAQVSAQNLGVYPTALSFQLTKGNSESQVVNITNGSDKKMQFRLYLNDWIRDTLGGHEYYEPATIDRSCSKWITLNKNFVELEPGKSAQVTIKMNIPDEAGADAEMKWSMLFVETVEENTAQAAKNATAAVQNLLRIGIHIYQTPPTLTDKQIKAYDLKPLAGQDKKYQLFCQNTGNVMIQCKSYLELASMADGQKVKLEPIDFPMFPQQKRYVTFELPANIQKGKYSALAVLDGGEDISLEAVESVVEVK